MTVAGYRCECGNQGADELTDQGKYKGEAVMKRKLWGVPVAAVSVALALSACIDSGGGSSSSISLTGTWVGVHEHYDAGTYYYNPAVAVVDGTTITDIDITNVASNLTGSFSKVQSKIYSFTLSNGAEGGFMVDGNGKHAGLLDMTTGNFAAFEKGATAQPNNFVQSDIAGNWSGYSILLDDYGDIVEVGSSSATVTCPVSGDCSVNGTDLNGAFSGTFPAGQVLPIGNYWGTFSNTVTSGWTNVLMTADKRFAASYACAYGYSPPSSYCTYQIWNKN